MDQADEMMAMIRAAQQARAAKAMPVQPAPTSGMRPMSPENIALQAQLKANGYRNDWNPTGQDVRVPLPGKAVSAWQGVPAQPLAQSVTDTVNLLKYQGR